MSEILTLLRGLDAAGNSVLFFDGNLDTDALNKIASDFGGNPVGEPAPGTSATAIAEVKTSVEITPVDGQGEVTIHSIEDAIQEKTAEEKQVVEINKGITQRGVLFFAKEEIGDEGIAIGIVLEPTAKDDGTPLQPDTQGDVYTKEGVRKGAYIWLLNGGAVDLLHSWQALGKDEILGIGGSDVTHGQSEFTRPDGTKKQVLEGTWLVTTIWNTKGTIWPQIKAGTLGAYSIGGTAQAEPVNDNNAEA